MERAGAVVYSYGMPEHAGPEPHRLVAARKTETFTVLSGRFDSGVLVLCDHAGNAFPPGYGRLGLPPAEIERHIAYDIGAAAVARHLAAALEAPAILTHYSRLLIDCNRGLDDPTLIMRLCDGTVVPGNRHVDLAESQKRIRLYYEPYHAALDGLINDSLAAGVPPALVSIHSFTEAWRGCARPWHAAILWDKDPRLARPLLAALAEEAGLVIGENEPYSGRLEGDSMWRHGTLRGLAHAIIEVRQDLIRSERGQEDWGLRLTRVLRSLLAREDLRRDWRRVHHYGSHAG